jgi:hypothetical protein
LNPLPGNSLETTSIPLQEVWNKLDRTIQQSILQRLSLMVEQSLDQVDHRDRREEVSDE